MAQAPLDANDRSFWEWLALRAEARLQGQLAAAIAADQRAMVWSGLLAAVTAALASAASICLTGTPPRPALGYIACGGCVGLVISLIFAVLAARPADWFYPGTDPAKWRNDIAQQRDGAEVMSEFCANLTEMIDDNERLMKSNGKMLMLSVYLAMITLGVCVFALARLTFG